MTDFKETAVGYLDVDDRATFSSSERKWINKIIKLRESYPDDVQIEYMPEDNHGMLLAHIPKSWLKIKAPTTRNLTDEQREAATLRLADARAKRNG
ncbi:MAG: hypothetical protein ACI33M_13530 [Lysinibacillus sp.]